MEIKVKWSISFVLILFTALVIWGVFQFNPVENSDNMKIDMVARQFSFAPNNITVEKGTILVLHLTTEDVTHGIEIPEFGVFNVQIPKGEVTTIEFKVDKTGQFSYYCTVFCGTGHSDHIGTLTVI